MDYKSRLSLSYYKNIATINQEHNIYMVQHLETHKIYIKKVMSVYNLSVFRQLKNNPIIGLPRIYEIYEEKNTLTIIEEHISGKTFEELIKEQFPFSNEFICECMRKLCSIVNRMHSLNPPIIHRDIKPSNIIFTESHDLYLIDLNAAKFETSNRNSDTQLIGTQGYAAPEQYGFGTSSIRTDIYAMGALLNVLVTGDLLIKPAKNNLFAPIINKAMQLDPNNRFPSANAMLYAINQLTLHCENSQNRFNKYNGHTYANSINQQQYNKENNIAPSNQATNQSPSIDNDKKTANNWLPPGFRSLNPFKMIVAVPCYIYFTSIFYSVSPPEDYNMTNIEILIYKLGLVFTFYLMVLFSFNYRNIQRLFPLKRSENKKKRITEILLYDFLILVIYLCIWVFIKHS